MAANELVQAHAEAPWMEPLEAYRILQDEEPLLLDGMGLHPEARYAHLALDAAAELRSFGRSLRETRSGRCRSWRGDPLDAIRSLANSVRVRDPAPGFTGGLVGYAGYGLVRHVPPGHAALAGGPDAVFRLCLTTVRFDRPARRATVYATGQHAHARARAEAVAGRLADADERPVSRGTRRREDWRASLDRASFTDAVERVRRLIHEGDLFQANIATGFTARVDAEPSDLFGALAGSNPSPFMALLDFGDHTLVSNSPEELFALEDGVLRSRPIAGTRPRGTDETADVGMEQELLSDPKEQAEHTMLVDLVRNDVARVSRPGTVRVPERMSVERYSHVMHLVSRVEGQMHQGADAVDCLAALFPGGTITGAPKHRACLRIREAEPVPRGPYTGSAGFIGFDGSARFNILIRTLVLRGGRAHVHAGSGIVADSDPDGEWEEANQKARALLDAATGHAGSGSSTRLGEVTRHGSWDPPDPQGRVDARVLVVDNYDSFVYNLADYASALGARVRVVRNDTDLEAALAWEPSHVVLSPGPGRPEDAGFCEDLLRRVAGRIPVLGVCLGHQAMATAHGGSVAVGEPVHGKPASVSHDGTGLFTGLPNPLTVGRYHSLHVQAVPAGFRVNARHGEMVMAMEDPDRRQWGVQFHPESLCTEGGLELLLRFLQGDTASRGPDGTRGGEATWLREGEGTREQEEIR